MSAKFKNGTKTQTADLFALKLIKTFNEFQQFTLKLGIEFVPTAEYHLKKQQERQLWEDGGMNTKESE